LLQKSVCIAKYIQLQKTVNNYVDKKSKLLLDK